MISAEDDQQGARRGWHKDQAIFREGVRVQHAPSELLVANKILLLLTVSIQNRQVEIRRRVVLGEIARIGSEELMRDQRSIRKSERGIPSGVWQELNDDKIITNKSQKRRP